MQDLFAPALAQFALTFLLGLMTAALRLKAAASRKVSAKTLKIGGLDWPKQVQQIGNTFNNQFESPIYFFAPIDGRERTLIRGRFAVETDDIVALAPAVLRHRLVMSFEAEAQGIRPDDLVRRVIETTPQ